MRPRVTPEASPRRGLAALGAVLATAALWVSLYHLNEWAFTHFEESRGANWIFLPAGLRLLAVLVWGWAGALGLWVGTFVTASMVFGCGSAAVWVAPPLSALAPLIAVGLLRKPLGLRPDLQGLRAADLAQLALASATLSAALHSLAFVWVGAALANPADVITMLVGDLVGTFVVLYALKLVLSALPAR